MCVSWLPFHLHQWSRTIQAGPRQMHSTRTHMTNVQSPRLKSKKGPKVCSYDSGWFSGDCKHVIRLVPARIDPSEKKNQKKKKKEKKKIKMMMMMMMMMGMHVHGRGHGRGQRRMHRRGYRRGQHMIGMMTKIIWMRMQMTTMCLAIVKVRRRIRPMVWCTIYTMTPCQERIATCSNLSKIGSSRPRAWTGKMY